MSCSLFTKPPASCCGMLTNQETKYSPQALNAYGAPVTQNTQQRLALNASYAGFTRQNYSGNERALPSYITPSRIPREYGLNERQLAYSNRTLRSYEPKRTEQPTLQKPNSLEAEIIDIKEINRLEKEIQELRSLKEAA